MTPDLRDHCEHCNGEGEVPKPCEHVACRSVEAWGNRTACRMVCPVCKGDGCEQADGFSAPEGIAVSSLFFLQEVA